MKKKEEKKEVSKAVPVQFPISPAKVLDTPEELYLFTCPNCGGVHFRHAGYLEVQMPLLEPSGPKVLMDSKPVKLCVKCKHAYISHEFKTWDVTKHIDLEAWEKTEVEAHKATGPGGQC